MTGERWLYTAAMVVAAVAASLLLRRFQQPLALPRLQRLGIAAGGLVGATVAAKIPFVIEHAELGLVSWLADGKTILWALAGGYLGVEVAKWSLQVRVRTGDTFVVPVAVAIAIGRLGCLGFGCCFGKPTELPWGLPFATAPDGGELLRHPTQIYESFFHLGAAILAVAALGKSAASRPRWWAGNLMPLYIIGYAVFRFFSEFLRPEPILYAGLTFYQLSAVGIAAAMFVVLAGRLREEAFEPTALAAGEPTALAAGEPTALAAGAAADTLGSRRPEASAYGSKDRNRRVP
ncbi:prolipoprotein diacylglyceryl transferase [Candidatus Laterigemmans baculatus]|uniref:prolipoprotein diacylglyceryl transferase n=1 Tax=Candidatus Laterigemmans baculatus TaxID=2770505 RepID=UPI001F1840C8|nr:prolipoprotein diacylglyceryl transferase family protein [Candidatus Laterigemmans baculatus]